MSAATALDPGPPPASDAAGRSRTKKAPNAFRTISEVADDLHIPQHVLRFWETKFPQVKPLKRGGGRRYYRPDDIQLLRGIADLLYTQGYTIKGVQRLLRESGGRLGDNIPPASEAERASGEVEQENLALFPEEPEPATGPDPQSLPPEPAPPPRAAAPAGTDLLREILVELEHLRSLLG